MKRSLRVAISSGVTLLLLFFIYRQVPDWQEAWKVMIEGRPVFLALGIAAVMVHMLIRAMRWGVLLSPYKPQISLTTLFSLTVIKYLVNLIPPRTGEVAASILLARRENLPTAQVIATSMLERVLDLITVIAFAVVYFVFYAHHYAPKSDQGRELLVALQDYSANALVVSGFVLVGLWIFSRKRRWSAEPTKIQRLFSQFLDGFRVLHKGGTLFRAMLFSIGIWIAITLQTWFAMRAYLENFPYSGSLLLMVITAVGVAIPTPGGIGGFHYFLSLGLVHFFSDYMSSVDLYSQAAGISNGAYIIAMLPLLGIGLILINRDGLSFGTVTTMDRVPSCLDTGEKLVKL